MSKTDLKYSFSKNFCERLQIKLWCVVVLFAICRGKLK